VRRNDSPRLTIDDLLREARGQIDRVTPEQAAREIDSGAVLVDTRCSEDRAREGTIAHAVHVPRTLLEWRADPACDHCDPRIAKPGARLIVVCNDGYSSSLAAASLKRLGFLRAADLIGGYRGWVTAGLPTCDVEPAR
jgi:rhodanese-related sulfurtransferase